ncbi:MAG: bifunctional 2-methylcitrate synthase/citrate synthase [Candidatus Hydrogenedentes bacterium]|nr:bifunctional 2-methylcitrate synthase/citrate synthase [Candidatus Hydrogenedentota bacterium]
MEELTMPESFSPGLEGVIAGETAVACVDQGRLLYRGYTIQDLAENASFEEVLHLLLYETLPDRDQLAGIKSTLFKFRPLAEPVVQMLRPIPKSVSMMDVLRSAVSYAAHWDPIRGKDEAANGQRALWLTSQIAAIIAARFRLMNGLEPIPPKEGLDHAAQILYQCHGEAPDQLSADLIDLTLVLYAEHEFNASTFACRVICSTLSDLTSAVVGAIGALKGPLHGGANEAAMEMLLKFKSGEEARQWIREALARKEKVMGFGHRVYKHGDHRADVLERKLRQLAAQKGQQRWMEIYDAIKEPMVNEKKIFPNVDYPCGLTYYLLGLPIDLYTPLFVAARIAGWSAHFIEQARNNRLYRPLSQYVGPPARPVPALEQR